MRNKNSEVVSHDLFSSFHTRSFSRDRVVVGADADDLVIYTGVHLRIPRSVVGVDEHLHSSETSQVKSPSPVVGMEAESSYLSVISSPKSGTNQPINVLHVWLHAVIGKQRKVRETYLVAARKLLLEASKFRLGPPCHDDFPHVLLRLARLGNDQCDKARTSFLHYVSFFFRTNPDSSELFVSTNLVVRFLNSETASRSVSSGSTDKGTCGVGLRRNLMKFGEQFDGFSPTSIMKSAAVKSASRGMAAPSKTSESNISVALVICLELHALGDRYWDHVFPAHPRPHGMSNVTTSRARDVLALIYMSLRGISFNRLELLSFVDASVSGPAFASKSYVRAHSVDKASSQVSMKIHDHCFLGVGMIANSVEMWIREWFDDHGAGEFMLAALAPKGSSMWEAKCLEAHSVSDFNGTITETLRAFAAASPICQLPQVSRAVGLSMRSSRHFIASVATALGESDQAPAYSVGHWKIPKDCRSAKTANVMPFRYAGSEQRIIIECQTRLRVFSRIQSLIPRPDAWQSVIPLQSGVAPSFAFLVSSPIEPRSPMKRARRK